MAKWNKNSNLYGLRQSRKPKIVWSKKTLSVIEKNPKGTGTEPKTQCIASFFVYRYMKSGTFLFLSAWIGSLAYGLSMAFGPITSILIRTYGYCRVMMIGGAICAFSVVTSSFATSIPQLFISFSLLYGIGTCMATGPTMTIAAEYFDKYLTIATGITVSGSSFGTLIMSPLSQVIIDNIGWRNAFRIFAGLHIITIILNSRIKAPVKYSTHAEKKRSLLLDFRIWKNRVFVVWTLAITLVMFGFYIPYVHLVSIV